MVLAFECVDRMRIQVIASEQCFLVIPFVMKLKLVHVQTFEFVEDQSFYYSRTMNIFDH